jgi:hypothetical protein
MGGDHPADKPAEDQKKGPSGLADRFRKLRRDAKRRAIGGM